MNLLKFKLSNFFLTLNINTKLRLIFYYLFFNFYIYNIFIYNTLIDYKRLKILIISKNCFFILLYFTKINIKFYNNLAFIKIKTIIKN